VEGGPGLRPRPRRAYKVKMKIFILLKKFNFQSGAPPQTPPAPGLRPWTPKRVLLTPPTTRLSAQTVGGGSGRAANAKGSFAYSVIPAKGCQPTPEAILSRKDSHFRQRVKLTLIYEDFCFLARRERFLSGEILKIFRALKNASNDARGQKDHKSILSGVLPV